MFKNEEEASVRSRESVDSLQTIGDAESTGSEAQRRRSERAFHGERERIHAGVVTQSMEGEGMHSLWTAMNVIERGQGPREEAKEVRDKVVATVEERWKAGELQAPLQPREQGWQAYIRMVEGRRIGVPPEIEAWAMGGGKRLKVHMEQATGTYRSMERRRE